LLRRAHVANEGYFDFDIGGVRYAEPQARALIAEGRTRSLIHYLDAMAYEYFSAIASVEEFEAKLQELATEAMTTFGGDSESLNSRKREWGSRARGRLALHSAMVERSQATFWRDLEMQFRAVNWPDLAAVLKNGWWSIGGLPTDRDQQEVLVRRFDALVGRALSALGFSDPSLAFAVWADHLQKKSAHSVGSCINNFCAASAEFCLELIAGFEEQVKPSAPTGGAIGRNIDRLRKECGWSYSTMARRTGIDKTSTINHVKHERRPRPEALATYAQAFSKKLERLVTVEELEA